MLLEVSPPNSECIVWLQAFVGAFNPCVLLISVDWQKSQCRQCLHQRIVDLLLSGLTTSKYTTRSISTKLSSVL